MGACGNETPTIPGMDRLRSPFSHADADGMGGAWG